MKKENKSEHQCKGMQRVDCPQDMMKSFTRNKKIFLVWHEITKTKTNQNGTLVILDIHFNLC